MESILEIKSLLNIFAYFLANEITNLNKNFHHENL
jgi:hypothetical protein